MSAPEQTSFAPRPIQLPAVLQFAGEPPLFGTIASLSERGLAFDCLREPSRSPAAGSAVRLDFDWGDRHHTCPCQIIQQQNGRVLLSMRDAPPAALAALHAVNRQDAPPLAARLAILQTQQTCHTRFMEGMRAVVDTFYQSIERSPGALPEPHLDAVKHALDPLRLRLTRHFTRAYPMYPELRDSYADKTGGDDLALVDMARVDDWIRRSGIAHAVMETLQPLPATFNRQYASLQKSGERPALHPYHAEAVLDVLADFIAPLGLDADTRAVCYTHMAQAFAQHATRLYDAMLHYLAQVLPESTPAAESSSLAEWLQITAERPASGRHPAGDGATAAQLDQLTQLVAALTENLSGLVTQPASSARRGEAATPPALLIPGLLARDRILGRFLPTGLTLANPEGEFTLPNYPQGPAMLTANLKGFDPATLDDLLAQLRQPPPIDPGPEKLSLSSQVRTLMLQAQGLLLEYTLNGLTYQAQPEHPAWVLINALDTLHVGADDRGQFLDPAYHQATSLAMQWLLSQEDTDSALLQVNVLLEKINTVFRAEHQARRAQRLLELGPPDPDPNPAAAGWCVVRNDDELIPHEILGRFGTRWMLLNRSATQLREIPDEDLEEDLNSGRIELVSSFDVPFLARTASASLTNSLNAIHAATWQDTSTGCLKRTALIDELARILAHPPTEPPPYCAMIEIPALRLGHTTLNDDELAVMRQQTGEILHAMLKPGEHCGRLNDISFLAIFRPQLPILLKERLTKLQASLEDLHPAWQMTGAVVPITGDAGSEVPSNVLRRANQACVDARQTAYFDFSQLAGVPPPSNQIEPLPVEALFLRAQKIAACDDGGLSHYEVLLGVDEALTPAHSTQSFVVMAEQTGRIHELDSWVLRAVLQWMDQHPEALSQMGGLSVNLSGNSLADPDQVDRLLNVLDDFAHLSRRLIIEVTETAAISNLDIAASALRRLRRAGCRVALDDFGSGYSSYGYLRRLPLDYLKIDGIYIRNLLEDKTDQALTASMVDVAHALGLKVIAEYVDNEATYTWLKDIGVDYVQGYWVHAPQRLDLLFSAPAA